MTGSRILIVDDDQDCCATLSDILVDLGYNVDPAYEGGDALELARSRSYRLALLDYKLPRMTGLELFQRLQDMHQGINAVMISGFVTPETADNALACGMRRVLRKPLDFDDLLPLVRQYAGVPAS